MSVFLSRPRLRENALAFVIADGYPVTPGHRLICTRRVVPTWEACTGDERAALLTLLDAEIRALGGQDYNVGWNSGPAAGQTIPHAHIHLIPRLSGDMVDPRGGVRHVIPEKGNYAAGTAFGVG